MQHGKRIRYRVQSVNLEYRVRELTVDLVAVAAGSC